MKQTFILLLLVSFMSCSTKDNARNDNARNDSVEQATQNKNDEYVTTEIADGVYLHTIKMILSKERTSLIE